MTLCLMLLLLCSGCAVLLPRIFRSYPISYTSLSELKYTVDTSTQSAHLYFQFLDSFPSIVGCKLGSQPLKNGTKYQVTLIGQHITHPSPPQQGVRIQSRWGWTEVVISIPELDVSRDTLVYWDGVKGYGIPRVERVVLPHTPEAFAESVGKFPYIAPETKRQRLLAIYPTLKPGMTKVEIVLKLGEPDIDTPVYGKLMTRANPTGSLGSLWEYYLYKFEPHENVKYDQKIVVFFDSKGYMKRSVPQNIKELTETTGEPLPERM